MEGVETIMMKAAKAAEENNPASDEDYISDDGLIYCGKCRTPKQTRVTAFGKEHTVFCICECEAKRIREEKAAEEIRQRKQMTEYRREKCITDSTYRKLTFSCDKGCCPNATETAHWYVDNFEELKAENKGLMFMGTVGTGKTFAACCIANELVERGCDVWMTTMLPLLRAAGDFNKCESVFERVENVDLLILDDFGTTRNTERSNELLFEIIDTRTRSGLPLIVTTNLTPVELKSPSDLSLARIYDRLLSMCSSERSPVILNGQSIRKEIAREKHAASAFMG